MSEAHIEMAERKGDRADLALISRREWLRRASAATIGLATVAACDDLPTTPSEAPDEGYLFARPDTPVFAPQTGVTNIGLGDGRDGVRYVPTTYRADEPLPLLLTLHGASGSAYGGLQPFLAWAEAMRVVLVSPASRTFTWDRRFGSFAGDRRYIDNALADTFVRCAIDPQRVAIAGFSDGAAYALSLGLTNGELFRKILAFSPSYMTPNVSRGKPPVFVSHGTRDAILPIASTSRVFVPRLQSAGYSVTYREFDGEHEIPAPILNEGLNWLAF